MIHMAGDYLRKVRGDMTAAMPGDLDAQPDIFYDTVFDHPVSAHSPVKIAGEEKELTDGY